MGIHKAMKNESKDVLFRIPKSHYFRTRYREMSIPMAPSSEIFIDDISKKSLIFKEKGLDLIGRWSVVVDLGRSLFAKGYVPNCISGCPFLKYDLFQIVKWLVASSHLC